MRLGNIFILALILIDYSIQIAFTSSELQQKYSFVEL